MKSTTPRRPVRFTNAAVEQRRFDELRAKLMHRLVGMAPDDPIWEGIHLTVDRLLVQSVDMTAKAGVPAEDRSFQDGYRRALLDIVGTLDAAKAEADNPEPDRQQRPPG